MAAIWIGVPNREEDASAPDALSTADPAHFVGNGPFMLTEHEPDVGATWEANPNYQGPLGPVKLKKITFKIIKDTAVAFQAYKNSELDYINVAAEDLATAKSDPALAKEFQDLPG